MTDVQKADRIKQVVAGAREFSIGSVLFHHAAGEILGVNVTDMECLALVVYRGVATPSDLARYTGLSSGATTAMLDRLERNGLVERGPNPRDRRGTLIVLTKRGEQRLTALFGPLRKTANGLLSGYTVEELGILLDFFQRMNAIWKGEREKLQQR